MAKRLCLVDDLKMLKITMSNTSSRNKLNPEINDHYNILTGECQKDELKTKDKALPHGRMILASVEKGPLVWPSITVDGATRLKEYIELTPAEAIQADCDIKAINIILQGLPTEIYALVSQHRVAKDLWEKIKLLMQGTSLTKQERECKLYDEFDKFTYKKGESLHEYYLRFTLLLNDMNIYKMPLEQFQVNTKFLNTLPDEWSKFVTDVKLVKDLHTTNVDQLHAYLQQHERHANEFITPYQTQRFTTSQSTPLSITYPSNEYQSSVHHNIYSPQSSIPQLKYAPTTYQHQQSEFSQPDSSLIVLVFQKGDDPIDAINHMVSFLTAVVTSRGDNKLLCLMEQQEENHTWCKWKHTGRDKWTVHLLYLQRGRVIIAKQCTEAPRGKRLSSPTMLLIKPMIWMPMTLIVIETQLKPRLLLWQISPGNGSDALTEVVKERATAQLSMRARWGSCPNSINNFGHSISSEVLRGKRKRKLGVRLSTSASGSQPSGNTRNDRILQTPSINRPASVQYSKKHANSDYVCINGDDCMSSDNLCVSNSMNDVKFCAKSKTRKSKKEIWKPTGKVFNKMGYIWRPTGRTFTIVGNVCPLTRITTTNEVPSRKPIVLDSESPKPVVKLVVQIVKFGNDQVCKRLMGYGGLSVGNVLFQVEPKNYKDALTQACWIEAMQEELHEFERLSLMRLGRYSDKQGSGWSACGYRQARGWGIDFEESSRSGLLKRLNGILTLLSVREGKELLMKLWLMNLETCGYSHGGEVSNWMKIKLGKLSIQNTIVVDPPGFEGYLKMEVEIFRYSDTVRSFLEVKEVVKCKEVQRSFLFTLFNDVPPPYTGNFMPPKPDLSFSGLEEFTSEPIVINPIVENSEAKASEAKPKAIRKNNGSPTIKDWVYWIMGDGCASG
ncbi:hypothetical protein Tco_1360831 [Tanacetum coccineum]